MRYISNFIRNVDNGFQSRNNYKIDPGSRHCSRVESKIDKMYLFNYLFNIAAI